VAELVASWPVMRDATVAAWLAAALLSVTGVIALVRGEVFLGATLAQASTLGMIAAPWLAAALHAEHTALLGGDGFEYCSQFCSQRRSRSCSSSRSSAGRTAASRSATSSSSRRASPC
jgi:ABC-type Mn2+/Zn2+ transport system permease subunit